MSSAAATSRPGHCAQDVRLDPAQRRRSARLGADGRDRVCGEFLLSVPAGHPARADAARRPQARAVARRVVCILVGAGRHARLCHRKSSAAGGVVADRLLSHACRCRALHRRFQAQSLDRRAARLDAGALQDRDHLRRHRGREFLDVHAVLRADPQRTLRRRGDPCSISSATPRSIIWRNT